jgi:required for meiotic nuclear division protein 1
VAQRVHQFNAVAFVENLSLRQLAPAFPKARITPHELHLAADPGGVYIYPFGALVTYDLGPAEREAMLARLHGARPGLTTAQVVREEYSVIEDPELEIGISDGMLRVDRMTSDRAGVVSLTVAQSAAMEYYERIVDQLFARTQSLVDRLERRGTVPMRIRSMHRFIGEAIGTRTEVLSVLHLMDKPEATWNDPEMDRIYNDLRAEFDLGDRYAALESKLSGVQEALELILGVARDRRLVWLEAAIVLLIVLEIILGLARLM